MSVDIGVREEGTVGGVGTVGTGWCHWGGVLVIVRDMGQTENGVPTESRNMKP